jgi:hypothetical protein|nr:MAG TPA: hypothetical protein [Caudoviricetes sp.]
MKTQEFINKVFALDIVPDDAYFGIGRRGLALYKQAIHFDDDDDICLYVNMEQRNSSAVYTDEFHASEEELKELCGLVRQYAHTPIKAR